jgi:hypothetical protein
VTCAPPASKSLYAVGGQPGRGLIPCGPGYPLPPDQFAASAYGQFMGRTTNMLAALAERNDVEETVALREGMNQLATALARAARESIGLRS